MNTKVSSRYLAPACELKHNFVERIASEVIHPDDIDVQFTGTLYVLFPAYSYSEPE